MQDAGSRLTGAAVLVAAATGTVLLVGDALGDSGASGADPLELRTLAALAGIALVGRIALSWLPPGRPGGHLPRELPATWAASHLLGVTVLGYGDVLLSRLGLAADGSSAGALALLGTGAVAGLLRGWSLPGAMVPRHELRAPRAVGAARVVTALTLLALAVQLVVAARTPSLAAVAPAEIRDAVPVLRVLDRLTPGAAGDSRVLGMASLVAGGVLVEHALAAARRDALARRGLLLALASTPLLGTVAAQPEATTLGLVTGGAACAVCWFRQADRRACTLAVLAFATLAITCWKGFALGSIALLLFVAVTPAASRRRIAIVAGVAWLVSWPIASRFAFELSAVELPWVHAGLGERLASWLDLGRLGATPALAAAGGLAGAAVLVRRARAGDSGRDPGTGREGAFLLLAAAAFVLASELSWPVGALELPPDEAAGSWSRLAVLLALPLASLGAFFVGTAPRDGYRDPRAPAPRAE